MTAAVLFLTGLWLLWRPGAGFAGLLVLLCSLASCGAAP